MIEDLDLNFVIALTVTDYGNGLGKLEITKKEGVER